MKTQLSPHPVPVPPSALNVGHQTQTRGRQLQILQVTETLSPHNLDILNRSEKVEGLFMFSSPPYLTRLLPLAELIIPEVM